MSDSQKIIIIAVIMNEITRYKGYTEIGLTGAEPAYKTLKPGFHYPS